MMHRITVLVDETLDKKIRKMQADRILKSTKSVSYSQVFNDVLAKGLRAKN